MPSPSINLIKSSDGTGNAAMATVQSTRAPGASTIIVDTVDNIPATFYGAMGTPHTFVDPVTAETITVISEATSRDFEGHVDGTNLEIDAMAPGNTDLGSAAGDVIIIKPTTPWANNIATTFAVAHEDDGKLKAAAPINSPQGTLANVTPVGAVLDYAGTTAPTGWLFCYGQEISRTTYAALFTAISTTYGVGNGTTTFNVPDLRGRVVAGQDDMGGTSANRLTGLSGGVDGDVLGGAGGSQSHTLTVTEMPSHSHSDSGHAHGTQAYDVAGAGSFGLQAGGGAQRAGSSGTHTGWAVLSNTGGGGAHNNVQPTLILNKIIKY